MKKRKKKEKTQQQPTNHCCKVEAGAADAPSVPLLKTRLSTDPQVNVRVQLRDARSLTKTLAAPRAGLSGPWRHLW